MKLNIKTLVILCTPHFIRSIVIKSVICHTALLISALAIDKPIAWSTYICMCSTYTDKQGQYQRTEISISISGSQNYKVGKPIGCCSLHLNVRRWVLQSLECVITDV